MVAEGLVMAQIRYCLNVYACDNIRIEATDPKNKMMEELQVIQNKMLRIILNKNLKDRVSISSMLKETKMLSVNQIACLSTMIDTWKAINLNVEPIKEQLKFRDSRRFHNLLKGSKDQGSFLTKSAQLWAKSSQRFKTTNLLTIAKTEARMTVNTVPI